MKAEVVDKSLHPEGWETPHYEPGMDREWLPTSDPNVRFFDSYSMHSIRELYCISEICQSHVPERIVEYGTASGGLTRLLGRWAFITDAKVLSIENNTYAGLLGLDKLAKLLEELPIELLKANEYDQTTFDRVQEFAAEGKTMFYCDGGNKPLELRSCASILKPGDLLVTHDYMPEVTNLGDINLPKLLAEVAFIPKRKADAVIEKYNLKKVFENYLGENEDGVRLTRLLALQLKE